MDNPIILYENKYTSRELEGLQKDFRVWKTIDLYEKQLVELFEIQHPSLKKSAAYNEKLRKFLDRRKSAGDFLKGNWVYFPWNGNLIHMVNQEDYYSLRTNRNRNLITLEEQQKLRDFSVGMVGLSVGSSIATGLACQGISEDMKLAEFDSLETTNLNRLRAGVEHLGLPKIKIAAEQIYEINPYNRLHLFSDGLTKRNVKDFIYTEPKPKLIFEIIDDFEMKILLRLEARKAGIPVIMMANLGDSVLIDIERFDLDHSLPLFHGILGDLPEEILTKPDADRNYYAVKIVGRENVPLKALESVKEIGKSLVGRPQLSSTVTVASGLAVYMTKCVALGLPLESGRVRVSFDNLFGSIHN